MRKVTALLIFLGLVAASRFWPVSKIEPPAGPPTEPPPASVPIGGILGRVTRNGYPVVARIEVLRIRDRWAAGCVGRERGHILGQLHRAWVGAGDPVATAESDEAGRFRIEGLPTAVYDLRARTRDGTTGQWLVWTDLPGEVVRRTFDLRATGLTLLGRVRWSDGRPFAGEVYVSRRGVRTAADGRFVLSDLPRRREPIYARIPGEISRFVGTFDPDGEDRIDVVMDRGLLRREGRVLSADDGRPLAGIVVVASWQESLRPVVAATRTGPDGTFRIASHPDAKFAAVGDEHLAAWGYDNPGLPMEIRLRRRPVVTGRVVTPAGRSVAGAAVWLISLPAHAGEAPSPKWWTPILADGDGRFRFSSPVTGFAMVAVLGGGWISRDMPSARLQDHNSLAVDLSPGGTTDLTLVAVRSPAVTGRVADHAGNPVPGLRIVAVKGPPVGNRDRGLVEFLYDDPAAVTGPDGRYRIPTVPPGRRWTISIRPPVGYAVTSEPIRPEGEKTVDLALPSPPDRWVEVEVVSATDGRPVSGAFIEAGPPTDDGRSWRGGGATTRADGRARLGPFATDALVASVTHPDYVPRSDISLPPDGPRPWRVRVEPGRALAGYVRFPDGTPAAGAYVIVHKDTELVSEMRADAVGAFALRSLAFGRYRIWAYQAAPDGSVPQVRTLARAGNENIVLNLETAVPPGQRIPRDDPRAGPVRTGRLEGRVLDDAGRPVRGACVSIRSKSGRAPWPAIRTVVWTEADGRFAFDCTGDRSQVLRVIGPPHLVLPLPVHATAGDEEVEIRLAKAARPALTVIDADGEPLPDATILVSRPDEPIAGVLTNALGRVRLGGLDPESRYRLAVRPPAVRDELRPKNIPDWRPADLTIHLEGIRTLRGSVNDPDGFPVGLASLWIREARTEPGEWSKVEVAADGRFEVKGLRQVDLETRAGVPRLAVDAPKLVAGRIDARSERVKVEIDGGTWIGLRVPDWLPDEPGRVSLSWQGGVRRLPMPKSGRIRFHGVPARKDFSLHVGPVRRGQMAFRDDLLTGIDHELPLRAGHAITGRVLGPEEIEFFHMSIYGTGIALRFDLNEDTPTDHYRVEGLPEGEYMFTILAREGAVSYQGEIDVRTGEPTDLKLELWK